jgi:hypothetical protein
LLVRGVGPEDLTVETAEEWIQALRDGSHAVLRVIDVDDGGISRNPTYVLYKLNI